MPTQQKPEKVKLPPEVAKRLRDLGPNIEEAKKQMASLRKMGLNTQDLEDKLEWAETAQKVLLEDFT